MILIGGWLPKMAAKSKIKKKSVKRMTWTWVTILFLFITELLFYTYCRVQNVQMGIAISSERRKQEELIALQNSLKIELARLKAPERISVIARKNLGLGMPDPAQIILVP
jgi:cell division protein FtsL